MRASLRRPIASVTAAVMLAGCVSTQAGRIGADDGRDACRAYVVQLDSTGDFYGEDILRGAAIGAGTGALAGGIIAAATGRRGSDILAGAAIGALAGGIVGGVGGYLAARQRQAQDQGALVQAVGGDLANENRQLAATQLAFNQLVDCRVNTANRIRSDVRAGRMSRDQGMALMSYQRDLMRRDVALARQINEKIGTRGAEFDTAIENIAPGTKGAMTARAGRPQPVTTRVSAPIRIRPDAGAPQIGQLGPNEQVTVRPAEGSFALVETSSGVRGYVPANAVGVRGLGSPTANVGGRGQEGEFRQLAATNIARRDNFAESVQTADRLAEGQGFELAG
ncbi:SH3 domain-containing protein [Roseomonas eburnea]|uniref:SH3 domain-containing protein n=1 Tax=Neoroseomonas eburnea TaxID=1346889 RepID=A0A9X9XHM5_9PROT|nr:SH3 domain-containing protein [Neoroseomonas eburnea]MBR0683211.1 SH3 domain-containing protein [Neoroseomonas eburnea]